ncbi:MAG: tetratricopeptide repeat protein [Burkholderiales bacterium]|nr:tetratricopeptide repeat protein [Burkholderiales bacterium]
MSLLLQALQKAAKNRETAQQPVEPVTGFATNGGSTLELEPGEIEPAPLSREFEATAEPPPAAPARPARDEFPEPTAQQAAVVVNAAAVAKEPGFSIMDWARDHPVHIFAVIAGIFLAFYFVYVAVEIKYPGFWSRSGSIVGPAANNGPLVRNPAPSQAAPDGAQAPTQAAAPMPDLVAPPAPGEPLPPAGPAAGVPATTAPSALPPAPGPDTKPAAVGASPTGTTSAATKPATTATTDRPSSATSGVIVRADSAGPIPRKSRSRPAPAEPESDITFKASDHSSTINTWLNTAYDQLQKGQLEAAQSTYDRVLASDGRNVDALLGLASIAWQQGQTEKASELYYRVLQLDPQNAPAQSGLIGLMGRVDPTASETRLKQLISREPSGGLYFTLGNLYAGERLWAQAQQSYFQAFQLEPTNPDYAFNLAVGLEHLNQSKAALAYYRKALDLSFARGRAGFDQKQVITRIGELSAATTE